MENKDNDLLIINLVKQIEKKDLEINNLKEKYNDLRKKYDKLISENYWKSLG